MGGIAFLKELWSGLSLYVNSASLTTVVVYVVLFTICINSEV